MAGSAPAGVACICALQAGCGGAIKNHASCAAENLPGLVPYIYAHTRVWCCAVQAVWQQELVYNAQYQLAMAEYKVERASGGARTIDESAALIEKLEAHRAALRPAKVEHADMQAALRSAEAALGEPGLLHSCMKFGCQSVARLLL